jgi:hypothetical protein
MKQAGFFVVGDSSAKFGAYKVGYHHTFVPESETKYWENRGYTLIPCFIEDNDFEEWIEDNGNS